MRRKPAAMCSETSPLRLSFSHDLSELQVLSFKHDESNTEFQFSGSSSREFDSSSADELFSNGVILPVKTLEKSTSRKYTRHGEPSYTKLPPRPCPPCVDRMKNLDLSSDSDRKSQSKSFWGFSRSRSMNSGAITTKRFLSHLPLSRSNSTGSVPNGKNMSSKDAHKHNCNRQPSSSSLSSASNLYRVQKSGSGKNYGGSYGNGLRISPVLHIPTPCISKGTSNLFGLGSFLRVGKVKKTKP